MEGHSAGGAAARLYAEAGGAAAWPSPVGDRLEIWSLEGDQAVRSKIWTPYDDVQGGGHDVLWADFVDRTTLATSSRSGRVALWDIASLEPICHFETVHGAVPATSDDHKWIVFSSDKVVGLFDVEKRLVAAIQDTPDTLMWPCTAFSPSGRKIGCIAFNRILVWDTASGTLEKNFVPQGISVNGAIDFPDDGFILGGGKYLIALDTQIKLWAYWGADYVRTLGGITFLAVSSSHLPGVIGAGKVPHPEAVARLQQAISDPDLLIFRRGAPVKLNVSGIPGPAQQQVTESLTKKLAERECPVSDDAKIELVASIVGPKPREARYIRLGTFKTQEYQTWIKFVYQSKTLWELFNTNVPGTLLVPKGDSPESALRKATAQPDYNFYNFVTLPEYLQKPSEGPAGGGETLGSSKVTPTGLR